WVACKGGTVDTLMPKRTWMDLSTHQSRPAVGCLSGCPLQRSSAPGILRLYPVPGEPLADRSGLWPLGRGRARRPGDSFHGDAVLGFAVSGPDQLSRGGPLCLSAVSPPGGQDGRTALGSGGLTPPWQHGLGGPLEPDEYADMFRFRMAQAVPSPAYPHHTS